MKMQNLYKTSAVAAMLLISVFSHVPAHAVDVLTYENAAAGVKMNYPAAWEKRENMGSLLVGYFSPKEDANDSFQENLNVAVQNMTDEVRFTLEEYAGAMVSSYEKQFDGFNLLESTAATLVGVPAHKIVYTAKNSDKVDLKVTMYLTIKNDKIFIVTFAAAEDKYSQYLPQAMTVIDSLETI